MKEYFYTITEGMIDLGLRGTALNLFAIIFGYSQKGDGCCYATRRELARRCGVSSTNTIDSAMDSLIEKGLIRKVKFCKDDREMVGYQYTPKTAQGVQKLSTPYAKIEQGGYSKIAHNENNNKENKTEIIPPTPQEVTEYARQRGFIDPEGFAEKFIHHYSLSKWHLANGKPMKNWKQSVCTWEDNNKYRRFNRSENKVQATDNQVINYFK